jgi:hypothetical protein
MQENKKMSEMIREMENVTIKQLFESVAKREPTASELADVIEIVEELVNPSTPLESAILKLESAVETQLGIKPVRKTKPRAKRRVEGYINWSHYKSWFDMILDGTPRVLTFTEINQVVPSWRNIRRPSLRNRFRVEAEARGYSSVSVKFDDQSRVIKLQALK